jgi:hypothetical protein
MNDWTLLDAQALSAGANKAFTLAFEAPTGERIDIQVQAPKSLVLKDFAEALRRAAFSLERPY